MMESGLNTGIIILFVACVLAYFGSQRQITWFNPVMDLVERVLIYIDRDKKNPSPEN